MMYSTKWALPMILVVMMCLSMVSSAPSAAAAEVYWVLEGQSPDQRTAFVSAELPDGRLFVSMGFNRSASDHLNDSWIFDPYTMDWARAADSPNDTESSTGACLPDGKVYVFGGYSPDHGFLSDLLIYDSVTDSWSTGPVLPSNNTFSRAVAIDDDHIMLVSGTDTKTSCYIYCASNSTFYSVQDLPNDRFGGALVKFDTTVYYIGGTYDFNHLYADILAYDLDGGYWSTVGELPEPLYCITGAASEDGNIYLFGGATTNVLWESVNTEHAYVFNTFTHEVTDLPDVAAPIRSAAAFSLSDGRIIYFGGHDGITTNTGVYSLQVWEKEAWLTSSTVDRGDSVLLYVSIHTNFMDVSGLYGNAYLARGNVSVGPYIFDSATKKGALIEIPISESMVAGDYEVVFGNFNVSYGSDQMFSFEPLTLTVTSDPSVQDQLDDLTEENNDLKDQVDDLTDQNGDLQDQLNQTNAELSDLEDSTAAKLDAMVGYVILIIALIALAVGVVIMVRKK